MKFLIFGGSVFLSREVARAARDRGHSVACLSRGDSGEVPRGTHHIVADRSEETDPGAGTWTGLASHGWDAIIDVASRPSWVRTATQALAEHAGHWTYVSSVSAYADLSRAGGNPADTPTLEPADDDLDMAGDATAYGRNKVACENLVRDALPDRSLIIRPGLIVGPGDPSGRYTYWPERLSRGGLVLAPAPRDAATQVIDVRDLAAWIVSSAERPLTGVFDAVAPAVPFEHMLAETISGVEAVSTGRETRPVQLLWADPDELQELDVRPWAGPRSLPLWLPGEELAGMRERDVSATLAAGLSPRSLAETARDTLTWVRKSSGARKSGLTWDEEQDVLSSLAED